jgi:esterase
MLLLASTAARAGAPRCVAAATAGEAGLATVTATVACRRRGAAAGRALSSHAVVPLEVTDLSDASQPHTKAPVVFLHGLLGSGTNFRSIALAPSVRAGRRVLALDLRNHGKSPHVAGPTTLEAMADDVIAAADAALGGQPYNLVGHSLGGKTAALVALRAPPSALAQLVVMDISPVPYEQRDAQWGAVTAVVRAAAALDPARFRSRGDIDRALAVDVPDAGMRSFLGQNLVLRPDGSYAWRINLPALLASLPAFASFPAPPPAGPYAPASALPAVFIGGERSRYILPDAHGPAVRAFFPQATFHTVAGAGHWIHADKPAEFTALLAGLLK